MELPLKFESIRHYRLLYDHTISREELSESAVPDAMPDVARIMEAESHTFLETQACAMGRVDFSGRISTDILYYPEGEEGVRGLSLNTTFQFMEDVTGAEESSVAQARVRVLSCDVRVLNPRKLLLRIGLLVSLQVYQPEELSHNPQLEQDEGWGVERRTVEQTMNLVLGVSQKPFAFEDQLNLSGARAADRILKCREQCTVQEARIAGSRLVVKGSVRLHFLLWSQEDGMFQETFDLPFSQIMEGGGASEDSMAQVRVQLTGWSYTLSAGGSAISVSLDLLAQAVLRENRKVCLLTDAYSTRYPMELSVAPLHCIQLLDSGQRRQSLREVLECGTEPQTVQDAWASVGLVSQSAQDMTRTLTADVTVHVVIGEEGGHLSAVSRTWPVSVQIEAPEQSLLEFQCTLTDVQADRISGGVEVRLDAQFAYVLRQEEQVDAVTGVTLHEEQPRDCSGQPSIVLRRVQAGEQLWELAKSCCTCCQAIREANGLEGDSLPTGGFLLIPRGR